MTAARGLCSCETRRQAVVCIKENSSDVVCNLWAGTASAPLRPPPPPRPHPFFKPPQIYPPPPPPCPTCVLQQKVAHMHLALQDVQLHAYNGMQHVTDVQWQSAKPLYGGVHPHIVANLPRPSRLQQTPSWRMPACGEGRHSDRI